MSDKTRPAADKFMAALQAFEAGGDFAPFGELFADDAELTNLVHTMAGRDGAKKFWEEYRAAFGEVRSEFHHVTAAGDTAVMEWHSEGTLPTGRAIKYRGVSIIELRGDEVAKFRTYYDSAAFVSTPATT